MPTTVFSVGSYLWLIRVICAVWCMKELILLLLLLILLLLLVRHELHSYIPEHIAHITSKNVSDAVFCKQLLCCVVLCSVALLILMLLFVADVMTAFFLSSVVQCLTVLWGFYALLCNQIKLSKTLLDENYYNFIVMRKL